MALTPNSTLADLPGTTPTAEIDNVANQAQIRAAIGAGTPETTSTILDKLKGAAADATRIGVEYLPQTALQKASLLTGAGNIIPKTSGDLDFNALVGGTPLQDAIVAGATDATPDDSELLPYAASGTPNVLKKLTFANLLTWLQGKALTFSGQLQASAQNITTGANVVLTRGLGDARYLPYDSQPILTAGTAIAGQVNGSSYSTQGQGIIGLSNTLATNNASGRMWDTPNILAPNKAYSAIFTSGSQFGCIDFSVPFIFGFDLGLSGLAASTTGNHIYTVAVGGSKTDVGLISGFNFPGFGIRLAPIDATTWEARLMGWSGTYGDRNITAASNASPIQITSANHGLVTGQTVAIAGVGGNTAANGVWTVTVVDASNFTLNGSSGNAAFTSGGGYARLSPTGVSLAHDRSHRIYLTNVYSANSGTVEMRIGSPSGAAALSLSGINRDASSSSNYAQASNQFKASIHAHGGLPSAYQFYRIYNMNFYQIQ